MSSRIDGPRSLESSLQWALGLLVLAVLLAITGAGGWIGRQAVQEFVATRLAHDAEALLASLDVSTRSMSRTLTPVYAQPLSGHYFVARFSDGDILRSRSLWDQDLSIEPLTVGETSLDLIPGPRDQQLLLWRAGYVKQDTRLTLAVAEDMGPLLEAVKRFLWLGVLLALFAAGGLLWVQKRLLRRGFRRLDAVRDEVHRLTDGDLERLSDDVPAEVQPLVRELNQLLTAWRAHLERSRNAVGNLAHSLKTPLHLILQHAREHGDAIVDEQAKRMHQLIERELHQARLAGTAAPARRFAPESDIADLVATLQALHRDRHLDITTRIDTPERLPFDQEDMLELVGNLLDNAAKWADRRVALVLTAGEQLRIRVEDDGPGIDTAEAQALLSRGSRLDEHTPGHGLGLAIVNDIVKLYRGHIDLGRSQDLGGLAISVQLPLHSSV